MDAQLRTLLTDLYPPAGFHLDLDDHDWVRLMREALVDLACGDREAAEQVRVLLIMAEDLGYLREAFVKRSLRLLERYSGQEIHK